MLSRLAMSDTAEAGEGSRSCAVLVRVADNVDVKFISVHLTEDQGGEAKRMQSAHRILIQHTPGQSSMAKMGDLMVVGGDFNSYSKADFATQGDWDEFKAARERQGQGFVAEHRD